MKKTTNITRGEQEKAIIITVAITGHSGAGKSTVAKLLLEKLPNPSILSLDLPFIAAPLKFKEQYEQIFNRSLDVNDHVNNLRVAMDSSPTALCKYIEMIAPFLDEEAEKEKTRIAAETKPGETKPGETKYLLTDYFGLPSLEYWINADYRIMVDAPNKIERNARLVEREKNDDISPFWHPQCGVVREENLREMMENAPRVDFHLANSFDEQLAKDVQGVCDVITSKERTLFFRVVQ